MKALCPGSAESTLLARSLSRESLQHLTSMLVIFPATRRERSEPPKACTFLMVTIRRERSDPPKDRTGPTFNVQTQKKSAPRQSDHDFTHPKSAESSRSMKIRAASQPVRSAQGVPVRSARHHSESAPSKVTKFASALCVSLGSRHAREHLTRELSASLRSRRCV